MAIFDSSSSTSHFDLRAINFNEDYVTRTSGTFLNDRNLVVNGHVYEDILVNSFVQTTAERSDEFYGTGITVSNTGSVTAGTLNAMYSWYRSDAHPQWAYSLAFDDFSISAVAFDKAQRTSTTTDDQALISQMLSGADTIILSTLADYMEGRGGNDTIRGGLGADTLLGGVGKDDLRGGAGSDRLIGNTGGDTLTGGAGNSKDMFVFDDTSGADRITDFQDGVDRIEITSGATAFRQLTVTDKGLDVLVEFGNSSILIQNLEPAAVTEADFLFT